MKNSQDINIIPLNDYREHDETNLCWCKPKRDIEEYKIIIHNALDKIEYYENAKMLH